MLYKFLQLIRSLSKKELTLISIGSAVLLVSAILYGGYLIQTKTVEIPAHGGTWKEGIVGQPVFINPVISGNEADQDISVLLFDNIEGLSESIKTDALSKKWSVRLKEGLKWSDDEKITSDDVIFTFDTIINPESRSPFAANFDGATVSRISELEVEFSIPSSYIFFEHTLRELRVIPKHIFGNIPPANFGLSSYAREPIGSGPYKFKSFKKEKNGFISEYVVTVNKNYSGDLPYIKDIVFKFYSDESRLIKAFGNGDIDGFPMSDPANISEISVRHDINPLPADRYYAVFLNPGLVSSFRDIETRSVLSKLAPREEMVKDIFNDFALPSYGPIHEASNAETAEESTIVEGSLVGLEFNLTVPDIGPLVAMAEKIKSSWESAGAVINISALRTADVQESIRNRDYESLLFGNILNVPEDLYSFWHSSKRFYPGLNLAMFNNREADLLMEEIRSESDPELRTESLDRLLSIIRNNVGAIFLTSPDYLYISSPRLKGFSVEKVATFSDRFNEVESWYLNTSRKFK